jgi:large subunit ribosomal protein L22
MKAVLKNYRQSPRKVRLLTSLIQGKNAELALMQLEQFIKRGALPVKKLLISAIANSGKDAKNLLIKSATVNKGLVMKRIMPRAMGRASQILKRTSHVAITLEDIKK